MAVRSEFNRRQFLALGALTAAGLTATTAGCRSAKSAVAPPGPRIKSPRYWTAPRPGPPPDPLRADVCVYGATSAGVMAAVQAARLGHRVVLLAFEDHIGGLTTSGLGATDTGDRATIGGLARRFYQEVGSAYGVPAEYNFEPHIAQEAFDRLVQTDGVVLRTFAHLSSLDVNGAHIVRAHLDDGAIIEAAVFVDASYEGDLMAHSGVTSTWGREPETKYGESLAGVTPVKAAQEFRKPVDPFIVPNKAASGLLAGVSDQPLGARGTGDQLLPAFNFRLCLTDRPLNRLVVERPSDYRPERYELLRRYITVGIWDAIAFRVALGNDKYDLNSTSAVSTDDVGASQGWVEASFAERERIYQEHVSYQQGLLWFLANDRRLPSRIRDQASRFGLASDEFASTGGWPPLLYTREGRRMVSDYVVTEDDCFGLRTGPDPVALASYKIDTHTCQRIAVDGTAANEGLLSARVPRPYPVPFESVVPSRGECDNLVVPVCVSASHVAFSSIRLEPVYMMLGQSAGIIASLALDAKVAVQDIDRTKLAASLVANGQILASGRPA